MNNTPLITVVTVCYNAVNELEKTMLSVLNQTYDNIEYIVIDGGSKDGTVDIIKKYADRLTYWVSEPDKGIYDAMNKGIQVAKGEWVNFMNAGDWFVNGHVVDQVFAKMIEPTVGVVFGNSQEYRNHVLYSVKPTPFYVSKKKHYSKGICHQCIFTRTDLALKYPFKLQYRISADFAMFFDIYHKEHACFQYVNMDIAYYDVTGQSNNCGNQSYYEEVCIINPLNANHKKKILFEASVHSWVKKVATTVLKYLLPSLLRKIRLRNKTMISS